MVQSYYTLDIDIYASVALVISKEKANTLLEWEPISDKMIKTCFNSKHCKLTIYTPTNEPDKKDKEDWYEQLQQAVAKVSHHDMNHWRHECHSWR